MTQRILVVDDNPDIAQIVRMATRKLGRPVEVVSEMQADRALQRMERETFDLVIGDHRLRETDGLSLFAAARPAGPGEMRLLFTAHGGKLDPTALANAHLDGVIEKPMMLDALRVMLDAVLEREPHTVAALRGALDARLAAHPKA